MDLIIVDILDFDVSDDDITYDFFDRDEDDEELDIKHNEPCLQEKVLNQLSQVSNNNITHHDVLHILELNEIYLIF